MNLDTTQFIQINDTLFLAKNDPDFVRKYALYFPNDGNAQFEYAKELESQGLHKMAATYFAKAEEQGSYKAEHRLAVMNRAAQAKLATDNLLADKEARDAARTETSKKRKTAAAFALLLLLLAFLFLKDSSLFTPDESSAMTGAQNETPPVTEDLNYNAPAIEEELPAYADDDIVYTANELTYLIALNSIVRFNEERGAYPETLDALTRPEPENWLTEIPTNVSYKSADDSFKLYPSKIARKLGVTPEDPTTLAPYLFELHFYPSSNELALMSGDKLLAVYPVASGRTDMTVTSGKVLSRVVEPNGEGSTLGSRGFALANNYAIHGTNDPTSIGKNVTDGCLRLFNEDIEALYPYVSKGTPFEVKSGALQATPMFEMGLPILNPGATAPASEMTPDKVYDWKH